MNNTRDEYNKRLTEIETYFNAIALLDDGDCKIVCDNTKEKKEKDIDIILSRTLKASVFLLLYNLIEATISNSIKDIINSVNSKKLTYDNLSDKLKALWINKKIENIKDVKNIKKIILPLLKDILENKLSNLKKNDIKISRNIDAEEIKKIAKRFGFQESKNGEDLETIKKIRNKLAHGGFSFSDIGNIYSVKALTTFKNNTRDYLDSVIENIESYINNEEFKKFPILEDQKIALNNNQGIEIMTINQEQKEIKIYKYFSSNRWSDATKYDVYKATKMFDIITLNGVSYLDTLIIEDEKGQVSIYENAGGFSDVENWRYVKILEQKDIIIEPRIDMVWKNEGESPVNFLTKFAERDSTISWRYGTFYIDNRGYNKWKSFEREMQKLNLIKIETEKETKDVNYWQTMNGNIWEWHSAKDVDSWFDEWRPFRGTIEDLK